MPRPGSDPGPFAFRDEKIRDQEIRDQGSGIKDQGSRIRDQGSGIKDQGSRIRDVQLIPDTCLLIPKTGTTTSEGARSSGVA
jgi:hypothetical protein